MTKTRPQVDYNQLAAEYGARYQANPLPGVKAALEDLTGRVPAGPVLEVGCGTGHWLTGLPPERHKAFGLDLSQEMLKIAAQQAPQARLVLGHAAHLPFQESAFTFVFCINALHHFDSPAAFVLESFRLLAPGGGLAIVWLDPHTRQDRWYVYDFFPGTLQADLKRYPSAGMIRGWLVQAGFELLEHRQVEHMRHTFRGREVLESPFLKKNGTSQLALLSDEDYAAGMARLQQALHRAAVAGEVLSLEVDLRLYLYLAWRQEG